MLAFCATVVAIWGSMGSNNRPTTKKQFQAILEHVVDGVVVQDDEAQVVYINSAAARMMGWEDAAHALEAGRDGILRQVTLFDERGVPLPVELLPGRQALQGEHEPTRVIRARTADTPEESWRWAWVKASPIYDSKGERVEYVVSVFQEITAMKNVELGLLDANLRMTKLLEQALTPLAERKRDGRR
jgi:PAS domain-containing protein